MYRVCFVVLHYLAFDVTKNCVESILHNIPQSKRIFYHIIIVDNASPNNSYILLQKYFLSCPEVTLLQAPNNMGFAKGNNIGYRYALEKLFANFVIITNNDTEFLQAEFLECMLQTYHQTPCALMGPDILNVAGYHQNPYRQHLITKKELSRWIRNRNLWLYFLFLDKYLHLSSHLSFFRDFYYRRTAPGRPNQSWKKVQFDVVLHGACIIFTPLFVQLSKDYAFYPDTFLYCEEDILALFCRQNSLSICYNPKLQILHKESVSTCLSQISIQQKDFFFTQNVLKSLKVLKKLLKKGF